MGDGTSDGAGDRMASTGCSRKSDVLDSEGLFVSSQLHISRTLTRKPHDVTAAECVREGQMMLRGPRHRGAITKSGRIEKSASRFKAHMDMIEQYRPLTKGVECWHGSGERARTVDGGMLTRESWTTRGDKRG